MCTIYTTYDRRETNTLIKGFFFPKEFGISCGDKTVLFGEKGSVYIHNHTRNSRLVHADRIANDLQKAARSKESQGNKDLVHGLKSVNSLSLALKVISLL